jgi:hypothetical protein
MLARVKEKYPENFDFVDFRPHLQYSDWVNELHLKNSAFERCAQLLAQKVKLHIS